MIKVVYTFQCGETDCKSTNTQETKISFNELPEYPNLPAGWAVVKGNLVCDRHEVVVQLKDEVAVREAKQ